MVIVKPCVFKINTMPIETVIYYFCDPCIFRVNAALFCGNNFICLLLHQLKLLVCVNVQCALWDTPLSDTLRSNSIEDTPT